ncbi:MAG: cell wall-binding repeat-containing protein, partial [Coriobacteriia bacterium]|nr:cell wall-binding repeat-containing protein [Coriobacteriia bacterium]
SSNHGFADFGIDLTKPVLDDNGVPLYSGLAIIEVTASDALSGVQTLSWRLDDGAIQTATGPASTLVRTVTTGPGNHTLVMWAEDVAGNSADTKTFSFTVLAGASERLAARTRFSTAVAIAREGFDADRYPDNGTQWGDVRHVVIASGDDRAAADPLAASGLCWAYDAPLFLVSAKSTPTEVKAAIKEIALQAAPDKVAVHIVGGPVSVPDARYSEIAAYVGASKLTKDRLLSTGGRYDMAAKIAAEMQRLKGKPHTVLIANGADASKFFDALALSPIAAANGYPILLVTATSIPSATQTRINAIGPATVIVGGGPNTVSESVRKALGAERWSGRSRYDTAIDIANKAIARAMLSDSVVGIAAKLPDALTGGSMVGLEGGVLLLTDGASLTTATGNWLSSHKGNIERTYVFGGPNSVTATVLAQINARID